MLRKPPSGKKGKGLRSLPTGVRNQMGFMKNGGAATKKKKVYAMGGVMTTMTPKDKKTQMGTVVPTMMPPMAKMNIGGTPSKKKNNKQGEIAILIAVGKVKKSNKKKKRKA